MIQFVNRITFNIKHLLKKEKKTMKYLSKLPLFQKHNKDL